MDISTCPSTPTAVIPMIKVKQVRWPQDAAILESIREQVFIKEQKVPAHLEWDGQEQESQHFVAFYNGVPVGTARLVKHSKLTRMAVLQNYRQQGIGGALLKSVSRSAMHAGMLEITADAQLDALGFYLKHDFTIAGNSFYDANILHKPISKRLQLNA